MKVRQTASTIPIASSNDSTSVSISDTKGHCEGWYWDARTTESYFIMDMWQQLWTAFSDNILIMMYNHFIVSPRKTVDCTEDNYFSSDFKTTTMSKITKIVNYIY